MKPEDLKNSINFVESDDYMQTRLFAEISSKKKSKNKSKKGFKVAISAVLCCAILIVGLGLEFRRLLLMIQLLFSLLMIWIPTEIFL